MEVETNRPLLAGATGLEKAGWRASLRDELFYLGVAAAAMVVAGWIVGMAGSSDG